MKKALIIFTLHIFFLPDLYSQDVVMKIIGIDFVKTTKGTRSDTIFILQTNNHDRLSLNISKLLTSDTKYLYPVLVYDERSMVADTNRVPTNYFKVSRFNLIVPQCDLNKTHPNNWFCTNDLCKKIKRKQDSPGDKLIFEMINIIDPNGNRRLMAPFTITLLY